MNQEWRKIDLINQKRWGLCQAEEEEELRRLALEDEEFEADEQAYNRLFDSLDALHLEQMQVQMQDWEKAYMPSSVEAETQAPASRSILPKWLRYSAAAASLLLMAFLGYVNWPENQTVQAFQTYFQPSMANVLRGHEDDPKIRARNAALSIYNTQDYAKAEQALKAYSQTYQVEGDQELNYYLGVSLLAQDKVEEAKAILKPVALSQAETFADEAEWMLVLAELRQAKVEEAIRLAQPISANPRHNRRHKAEKLIKSLQ